MDINEFIERFAEIFDDTDVSVIKPDTKFRELDEWCSMSTLGVIDLADEEYGVELNADALRKAQTVEDLYNAIQSLK